MSKGRRQHALQHDALVEQANTRLHSVGEQIYAVERIEFALHELSALAFDRVEAGNLKSRASELRARASQLAAISLNLFGAAGALDALAEIASASAPLPTEARKNG